MIPAETQRFMAERMRATIRTHIVDHSPMYTSPDLVVNIVLEAVVETPSSNAELSGRAHAN